MLSVKVKRLLLFSSLMVVGLVYTQMAHANCPQEGARTCPSGYLCFVDWYDLKCGKVIGTNSNWTDFNWNDKADYFFNHGNDYDVCIYEHAGYNPGRWGWLSGRTFIKRGDYASAHFGVSSNRWTTDSSCPRG